MTYTHTKCTPAEVVITQRHAVQVGHHRCTKCEAWTPDPSEKVLREYIDKRKREGGPHPVEYIWPFHDWIPEGWAVVKSTDDVNLVRLCPPCAEEIVYKKVPV